MRVDAHTLAVDQVRLGDHAFFSYADAGVRWQIAAAGDKVIIVPDPSVSRQDAYGHIAALDSALEQALANGQVICASMREIISPDRRFSAPRQLVKLRDAAVQARRDGYRGLRLYVDMTWTH